MKTAIHQATPQPAHSPSRSKVIVIVIFFVTISFLLAGIIYLQGNVSDGVRAYVRGEGLWAKAQKDAVYYLTRYSYDYQDSDYYHYQQSIQANLGDKHARRALLADPPDHDKAREGFLQGNNDPRDIQSMIWFFTHFKSVKYMHQAILIWENADRKIGELRRVGEKIRYEVKYAGRRKKEMGVLREKLHHLDKQLLIRENRFSTVLGDGARWVKSTFWLVSVISLITFVSMAVFISIQIIRSITRSENELLESESRFRSLKESNTIGILSWSLDGTISNANTIFYEMLGYTEEADRLLRLNWRDLTPEEYRPRDKQALEELIQFGKSEPFEKGLYHKNGTIVPVLIGASLLSPHQDQGMAFVVDLSERKRTEEQLKLAATVLSDSRDGIIITDADSRIISANNSFCEMSGYTEQELIGTTPRYLQPAHISFEQLRQMKTALAGNQHWQGNMQVKHKNGEALPLRISISAVRGEHDKLTHYVTILSDNSQQKAQEDHLRHVALHDPLTDLPNRALFQDRITQAINYAQRHQTMFAVIYLDLNNFKKTNDQFGHTLGDKLLQTVAQRLTQNTRTTDTVTRLGGDEFVILLDRIANRKTAEHILNEITCAICVPCNIDGNALQPGISAGLAVYPEDGINESMLMHHADMAMYKMKNSTNGNVAYGQK